MFRALYFGPVKMRAQGHKSYALFSSSSSSSSSLHVLLIISIIISNFAAVAKPNNDNAEISDRSDTSSQHVDSLHLRLVDDRHIGDDTDVRYGIRIFYRPGGGSAN